MGAPGSGLTGPGRDAAAAERFTRMYETYRRPLLARIAALVGGDVHAAEDVLQETMLRAWTARPREPAGPWLYAVARRVVIDRWRARAARPGEVCGADLDALPAADDIDALLDRAELRAALTVLPPELRAVLVQVYYLGRSPTEAARALGVPVSTVRARVHRALAALRVYRRER